jgi:hypothetical protein
MQSTKQRKDANRRAAGIVRPLAADDPRNLNHPCHREQWLELARTLGRLEARQEFESSQHNERQSDASTKTRHRN